MIDEELQSLKLSMLSPKKNVFQNQAVKRILNNWQLYLLLLFPLIYIIIFKYGPMYGAQIAFQDFDPVRGFFKSSWVGFKHFSRFFNSPVFFSLLINTLGLSLYNLIAGFPLPILLAIALNYTQNRLIKKGVQMATYLPYFISVVVMVGILMQISNPRTGIINYFITMSGGKPIDFFGEPGMFKSLYVWSGVWQNIGWNSIIFLSALASIDPELHEAAIVDGAGKMGRIWHIDLPGILPTVVILLILNIGGFMSIGFEKVLLMQNPLNVSTSEVIDTYVYKNGIASPIGNFSYTAAIGLFQSFIGFTLIILSNKISKKLSHTSLW